MDRCALFVDAGYMLADGAMAVHGTRRRESVSWDYGGLLQLLGSRARARTAFPLLRCYWYEATVAGRRTAEHDAIADLPGIKLRLARLRPGRREGVETEIHRDLTVLARNRAVSDAVVVSAEEDLAQILSDVQDLGMRVTIMHVTVDGNWTISRALRQECDDIMGLTSADLRPYVELIPGAEPALAGEQCTAGALSLRSAANGHSNGGSTGSYPALPPGRGHTGPPTIYTAPVVAEYQRPMPPVTPPQPRRGQPAPEPPSRGQPAPEPPSRGQPAPEPPSRGQPAIPPPHVFGRPGAPVTPGLAQHGEPARPAPARPAPARDDAARDAAASGDMLPADLPSAGTPGDVGRAGFDSLEAGPFSRGGHRRPERGRAEPGAVPPSLTARGDTGEPDVAPRQDLYGAPLSMPPREGPPGPPVTDDLPGRGEAGVQGRLLPRGDGGDDDDTVPQLPPGPMGPGGPAGQGRSGPADYPARIHGAGEPSGYGRGAAPDPFRRDTDDPQRGGGGSPAAFRRAGSIPPASPAGPAPAGPGPAGAGPQGLPGPGASPLPHSTQGPHAFFPSQNGPHTGPQPAAGPGRLPALPVSLTDAVQSAHEEGREFGASVAREAPALWLEAVLARKPRMPSDLEARLLQGSALPIDFLLHDEVRHALRRGFWDALESSRRLPRDRIQSAEPPRPQVTA